MIFFSRILEDGNHAVHSSGSGGRESPPPPLNCLRHVFALGGTQLPPPHHCYLHARRRPENTAAGGRQDTVGRIDRLQVIRTATKYSDVLQVPWSTPYGNGRWLSSSHRQLPEGATDLGQTFTGLVSVGFRCLDVGTIIPIHSAVHTAIWRGDLGSDPAHRTITGEFSP